jgi:hypothetical protein
MGTSRSRSAAPEKDKYPTGFGRGSNSEALRVAQETAESKLKEKLWAAA